MATAGKLTLYAVVGPTASGKTALGIELARRHNGAVLSADSRQVYAGLNIGTAKPEAVFSATTHETQQPDILEGIPHYFFNIRDIKAPYHLADWQTDAFTIIDDLGEKNQTPIMVGGTMLYVDSVALNFSIPHVAPNEELRQDLEQQNVEDLYAQLLSQDPRAATFVQAGNKRRIIRALEVMAATNQPFSAQRLQREPRYEVKWLGLFPGFETLQTRIEERIQAMIAAGLVEETRQLQAQYGAKHPLLQTINYAQAGQVLAGQLPEADLALKMTQANVRYAHRQMSWWRNNGAITWYKSAEDCLAQ